MIQTQGYRIVKFFPKGWREGIKDTEARVQISFNGEPVLDMTVSEWSFMIANGIDLTKPPQKPKKVEVKAEDVAIPGDQLIA